MDYLWLSDLYIVPSVGTGIKAYIPVEDLLAAIIVPSVGTGIKILLLIERNIIFFIVPFMGMGIKAYISLSVTDMGWSYLS